MSGMSRRVLGIALIVAGPVAVVVDFLTAPSANACARINDLDRALGAEPTCSTAPSMTYLWAAAALVIAGLLVLIPWWRRLVEE
jgi:hypothetical protein